MTVFHLYAAYSIVPTQPLRYAHVAFVLILSFLLFPMSERFRNRIRWWDVLLGAAGAAYPPGAIDDAGFLVLTDVDTSAADAREIAAAMAKKPPTAIQGTVRALWEAA